MNKDVIYIEPEDDITDIITKIENSKEKIIALVPPKKAGILRSIVNIKLLVKAGTAAKKTIVLVTTDPSIIKLAASVKLPVTKDLTTAPTIPDGKKVAPIETTTKEKLEENLGDEKEEEDSAVFFASFSAGFSSVFSTGFSANCIRISKGFFVSCGSYPESLLTFLYP
jgi:hypothetical protein